MSIRALCFAIASVACTSASLPMSSSCPAVSADMPSAVTNVSRLAKFVILCCLQDDFRLFKFNTRRGK